MARRKSIFDSTIPYTPEKQLETNSGWCITKDHERCPYQFTFGKCGCSCHLQEKKESAIIADEDPRPWRNDE